MDKTIIGIGENLQPTCVFTHGFLDDLLYRHLDQLFLYHDLLHRHLSIVQGGKDGGKFV